MAPNNAANDPFPTEITSFILDVLHNSFKIPLRDPFNPDVIEIQAHVEGGKSIKEFFVGQGNIALHVATEDLAEAESDRASLAKVYAIKLYRSKTLHFISSSQRAGHTRMLTAAQVLGQEGTVKLHSRYMDTSNEDHFVKGEEEDFCRVILDFMAACIGITRAQLLR